MDKPVPVPTALTPKVHEAICEAVKKGVPMRYAAAAASVGESTLRKWLAEGREHPESNQGALLAAVEDAKAELIERCLSEILAAQTPGQFGVPDWKARAWILERCHREQFSQHQEQHIKVALEEGVPNFEINPRRHTVPEVTVETNGDGRNGSGEKP
ncbi:MAG: hypothetical protein V3W06_09125 [Acidimicrobiia bacterium]